MISGAARGIGASTALKLAEEGADISASDLCVEELEKVCTRIRELDRRCLTERVDIRDSQQVLKWTEQTHNEFGHIDILVNNAGIIETVPFLEIQEKSWDRIINTNLKGTFLCSQIVARIMVSQKDGRIINISSVAGRSGRAFAAHYAASKAAIINLSRSMALALAEHGIRVNAICPGITDTPMWEELDREKAKLFNIPQGRSFQDAISKIPLQRAASPEEIASMVVYLASQNGDYITGQAINICGGMDRDC